MASAPFGKRSGPRSAHSSPAPGCRRRLRGVSAAGSFVLHGSLLAFGRPRERSPPVLCFVSRSRTTRSLQTPWRIRRTVRGVRRVHHRPHDLPVRPIRAGHGPSRVARGRRSPPPRTPGLRAPRACCRQPRAARLQRRDHREGVGWAHRLGSGRVQPVKSARKALGDDGKTQRYIKTIQRRGFRFVADVNSVRGARPPTCPDQPPAEQTSRPWIAVLPFTLIGEAGPYAAIADALPHELIAELSRWLVRHCAPARRFACVPRIPTWARSAGCSACATACRDQVGKLGPGTTRLNARAAPATAPA